jgi:hypothetical protein
MLRMMFALCLALLVSQDQTAAAKKLLEAVVPLNKEQPYLQLVIDSPQEDTVGATTQTIYFRRQKAYRIESLASPFGFDGTRYWIYQKAPNNFRWFKKVPFTNLLFSGGVLAELCMYGNADRIIKETKQITVRNEPLGEVPCSHIILSMKQNYEVHVWIDAKNQVLRNQFKSAMDNRIMTYKFVDPPATDASLFSFTPPPDAKDLTTPDDR